MRISGYAIWGYTSDNESDNVFLPPNDNGNNKENDEYQKEFVDYVNSVYTCDVCKRT